jgi:MscS family membrane protein
MEFTFLHQLDAYLCKFPLLQEYDLLERLVIVLIYMVLAKVFDLILIRSLRRVARKTRMHFDDFLIDFFHRPFLLTVILVGVLHACSVEPQLPGLSAQIIPNLSKTLILMVWWGAVSNSLGKTDIERAIRIFGGRHIDTDIFLLFKNVSRILVLFFTILWILLIWKINLSPLFASAGIVGIAIALAAKDTLANFFGGISVFMDRAYKVGEYIILESGERGEVVEVGIRSTKIQTRDDVMITIPNGIMANSKIINESAPQPRFRIRLDIGVAYGTDLDMVEALLLQVADENNQVVKQPAPRVRLRTFGDSAVNFQLLLWIRDPREKGRQTHLLLKEVYRFFNENDISIPFPQRDVYIRDQVTEDRR